MKTEFKEVIISMSEEFDEKEGYVTCEVSIHRDTIPTFKEFVKENVNITLGKWVIMECDTCVSHNGEGYVHVSIERFDTIDKILAGPKHLIEVI